MGSRCGGEIGEGDHQTEGSYEDISVDGEIALQFLRIKKGGLFIKFEVFPVFSENMIESQNNRKVAGNKSAIGYYIDMDIKKMDEDYIQQKLEDIQNERDNHQITGGMHTKNPDHHVASE